MSENKKGVIYILTNPSFLEYVKIGYADDIEVFFGSMYYSFMYETNQIHNCNTIPFLIIMI